MKSLVQPIESLQKPKKFSTHYCTRGGRSALVRWTPASNAQRHFGPPSCNSALKMVSESFPGRGQNVRRPGKSRCPGLCNPESCNMCGHCKQDSQHICCVTQCQISQAWFGFAKGRASRSACGVKFKYTLLVYVNGCLLTVVTYVCVCGSGSWMRVSTSGSGSRYVLIDSGMQGFSILPGLEVR